MKAIFKKLDITGVAVMMLMFFVAVGFTPADNPNPSGWYEVINGEEENPSDQLIGDHLSAGPLGDCGEGSEIICAVQLTFTDEEAPKPSTVQDAMDASDVSVGPFSSRDED